ncbi:GHKL domain-containing protein [Companilactobacillus huachuanensis]|uniref:GHKL domain-containing protein n=1 Tax=Companilactobacillus huachuanensis TaxID=2559914 RepID=A0ABW1RL22_9LACO|nr:GHKL domain-containing protein [Companilactobacillus huachuanensis]
MIYIDPTINVIGHVLSGLIFFCVFSSIYRPQKNYLLLISSCLIVITAFFLPNYAYFIDAIVLYLIFQWQQKSKLLLINTILLSSLIQLLAETLANTTALFFTVERISTKTLWGSILFVSGTLLIQLVISVIFVVLYKHFNIEENWNIAHSALFGLLIAYLFIVIFFFMRIIQHYRAYSDLISGIMLFILIQCFFIVIVFLKGSQTQAETYTRELTKEQLKNLKMYTDQLETDQIKLRGFERNYKGTISSLRKIAKIGDYQEMRTSLGNLEDYSNSYFDNISMQLFKDLNNVQNPYLKSLLISKLTLINQNNITCHFECRDAVNDGLINIFDLVRLLGISIDNAIEATKDQSNGEIQIAIIQEVTQLSFVINNTIEEKIDISDMMQEGFTTKQQHSGLGMVNVQDIKKKYPNLFVQYRKNDTWFNLNLVIIK